MLTWVISTIVLGYLATGSAHPGGPDQHSKFDMVDHLQRNIASMKGLLSRQERRLVVGLEQLKKRVTSLDTLALKVEQKMIEEHNINEVSCEIPEAPTNGHVLGISTDTNGVAKLLSNQVYFVCNEGFLLVGSETRECLANGTWSGQQAICVDIREKLQACAKLNCQNSGACVLASNNKYRCNCTAAYSGRRCEIERKPLSGAVRMTRCTNRGANTVCRCDPGFKKGANQVLCFDKNECNHWKQPNTDVIPDDVGMLTKRHVGSRVLDKACRYKCVNTPGSFRCTCPPGYRQDLKTARDCIDIDECGSKQDNCSVGEQCFNTGGSYRCVRPTCPTGYTNISPFVCQRNRCTNRRCRRSPLAVTFHYIDLPASLTYPVEVFRTVADASSSANLNQFFVDSPTQEPSFAARKYDKLTGALILKQPLDVANGTDADFLLRETTKGKPRRLVAKYLYRVRIFPSPYSF